MQAAARGVSFSYSTTSSSSSRRVFIEISNAVLRSNIRGRGKSFAASVPSSPFKPKKGQKRIPKQERRAMVESFVGKYRASNAGQFPTASQVRQQIGGSYYNIRLIIQELEYNHKKSRLNNIEEVRLGKTEKVIYVSSDAKDELSLSEVESPTIKVESNMKVLAKIDKDEDPLLKDGDEAIFVHGKDAHKILAKEILQDNDQDSSGYREPMASTSGAASAQEDDFSVSVKLETTVDTSCSPLGDIEGSRKDTSNTECLKDSDGPKGTEQTGICNASKSEELNGGEPRKSEHGESTPPAANFWGNLKSFADGIIKFWKKM